MDCQLRCWPGSGGSANQQPGVSAPDEEHPPPGCYAIFTLKYYLLLMSSIELLSVSSCLLRWHQKVDSLWHQTPRITFTRAITKGVRAGIEETVCRRGQRQVVDGAKVTGEVLLKQYRKRVERMLTTSFLFDTIVTDKGIVMPSILVDARQLMQQRSLTERTMRNHLAQLMYVGFIVKKKWHGRKRSFELWINPDYILKEQEKAVEKHRQEGSELSTINQVLSKDGTKFPVIELPELQESQKFDIGQCGKMPLAHSSERPSPEAEGRKPNECGQQTVKQSAGGCGAAKKGFMPSVKSCPATVERQSKHDAYVTSAWVYAKALLYPEYHFNSHQEQLAKEAIRVGVYRNFQDEGFDFERYHKGVLRRIELVEKYFQKHAGRYYAPIPWAEIIKGRGYFDWENTKGFRGTMAWLLADQQAEQVAKVNRALRKAIGELKLRRKLDRGEKTTRNPAKHIQAMSFAKLYRHHEAAINQLAGVQALTKFRAQTYNLLR